MLLPHLLLLKIQNRFTLRGCL